jgi:hypothetical protein
MMRNSADNATGERGWSFNLDIFRVVFLAAIALPWGLRTLAWIDSVLPGLPDEVWKPISYYQLLPHALLTNVPLAKALALLDLLLLVLGLVGLFTRMSLAGAALLSLYVFGLPENQGKIDNFGHIIWFLALLAAGPSGRFFSLDAVLQRNRRERVGALWTLRYVWALLGLLYLMPGAAKLLKTVTAGWASAANLRRVLWLKWFEIESFWSAAKPVLRIDLAPSWVLTAAGLAVIAFELGFIAVVFVRRLRPYLALAAIAFHVGNGIFLGIWLTTLIPVYVCLIDFAALGRRFGFDLDSNKVPVEQPAVVRACGVFLVAAQVTISSVMCVATEVPGFTSRLPLLGGPLQRIAATKPVWPFHCYPTFAYPTPETFSIWEARWEITSREVRVSPEAYRERFRNSAVAFNLLTAAVAETEPSKLHAFSEDLTRSLGAVEDPATRAQASALRVYRIRYRLGPGAPPATPVEAELLDRFSSGH